MNLYYINRETGKKEKEIIAGENLLKIMNQTKSGNSILEMIIKKKLFSYLYGKLQDLSLSRKKINRFVDELAIDISEAEIDDIREYKTFNDFFTRKLKPNVRPINYNDNILISPADGKILAYENININKLVQIKGHEYSLKELIDNENLANEYKDGTYLVIRLSPSDYHRFHFPDYGMPSETKKIKGYYYSVNPISLKKIINVYCRNKREITVFNSRNFDKILIIEVGATCVGSIIQTYTPNKLVEKGSEKGYFKFGGSTVIMFLKKGIAKIDKDILKNTKNGYETKIKFGERIGIKINKKT